MNAATAKRLMDILRRGAPDEADAARGVQAIALAAYEGLASEAERASEGLGAVIATVQGRADLCGRIAMAADVSGPRPDKFLAFIRDSENFIAVTRRPLVGAAARSTVRAWEESGSDLIKAMALEVIPAQFYEAIADLESRDALLADAQEVERIYGGVRNPISHRREWPHGFAVARSTSLDVTRRVQDAIVKAMRRGQRIDSAASMIAEIGGWTESYGALILRNNTSTAYSSGRHREAAMMRTRGLDVGFEFRTAGDSRVRHGGPEDNNENHRALEGIRAAADDALWRFYSPPLG